jgi:ketosteroid isomerase-like protein
MRRVLNSAAIAIISVVMLALSACGSSRDDGGALDATSKAIRAGFVKGDVAEVMKYHHPEVMKALSFHNVVRGREALAADMRNEFQRFRVEFVENHVESLLIEDNTAIEQTLFTIKVTPLHGGEPSLFHGRAMVVYVRYKDSPTGWASIREMIQPSTN